MSNNSIPTPQSYLFQAPTGVPGDITRTDESNVEPAQLVAISTVFAQAYGIPMKYVAGGISQWAAGDAATAFAGVLVREVPSISGSSDGGLGDLPNSDYPQGLCVRGYVSVLCKNGTPARGGVVYVRVISTGSGNAVGDFEAASDGSNSVALTATQAEWASDGTDANFNAELRIAR